MSARIRKSENQATAEWQGRRSTYADEHARSWQVRFDRRTEPADLRGLVISLRRAYRDEMPGRLHTRDLDEGGGPAYSGEFAAILYGSPFHTEEDGTYKTAFRRCLTAMHQSTEPASRRRATIVGHVVLGGDDPEDAVQRVYAIGVIGDADADPREAERAIADQALRVFWRRCSDFRLDLGRTETAA